MITSYACVPSFWPSSLRALRPLGLARLLVLALVCLAGLESRQSVRASCSFDQPLGEGLSNSSANSLTATLTAIAFRSSSPLYVSSECAAHSFAVATSGSWFAGSASSITTRFACSFRSFISFCISSLDPHKTGIALGSQFAPCQPLAHDGRQNAAEASAVGNFGIYLLDSSRSRICAAIRLRNFGHASRQPQSHLGPQHSQ